MASQVEKNANSIRDTLYNKVCSPPCPSRCRRMGKQICVSLAAFLAEHRLDFGTTHCIRVWVGEPLRIGRHTWWMVAQFSSVVVLYSRGISTVLKICVTFLEANGGDRRRSSDDELQLSRTFGIWLCVSLAKRLLYISLMTIVGALLKEYSVYLEKEEGNSK